MLSSAFEMYLHAVQAPAMECPIWAVSVIIVLTFLALLLIRNAVRDIGAAAKSANMFLWSLVPKMWGLAVRMFRMVCRMVTMLSAAAWADIRKIFI